MTKFCNATNFTLCVLLESIDLMLLTLTRRAYNAIGGLGSYLSKSNWIEASVINRQVLSNVTG